MWLVSTTYTQTFCKGFTKADMVATCAQSFNEYGRIFAGKLLRVRMRNVNTLQHSEAQFASAASLIRYTSVK